MDTSFDLLLLYKVAVEEKGGGGKDTIRFDNEPPITDKLTPGAGEPKPAKTLSQLSLGTLSNRLSQAKMAGIAVVVESSKEILHTHTPPPPPCFLSPHRD